MKKKIVSLLPALTMMVSLLPVQVLAAGDDGAADAPAVTEPAGEEQTPENSADTEEPEEPEAPVEVLRRIRRKLLRKLRRSPPRRSR